MTSGLVYVPQHNACVQHVLTGRVAACATVLEALMFAGLREGTDYRVLARTVPIPSPLLAAAPPPLRSGNASFSLRRLLAWPRVAGEQGGPVDLDWMKLAPASDSVSIPLYRMRAGCTTKPDPERGT